MRKLLLLALFVPMLAQAGNIWYRAHDADSVMIGPICVPELAGEEFYESLDFDTSNLVIEITASGDGALDVFSYTGGDIDAGPADGTWGNPTTDAIEVDTVEELDSDASATSNCIVLSLRDEVLAVSGATEWSIVVEDGGTLILDWEGQILALSDSADNVADVATALANIDLDHLMDQAVTGTDITDDSVIAQLVSDSATADWDDFDNETDSLEALQVDVAAVDSAVSVVDTNIDNLVLSNFVLTGTCDSGTTSTCVDATLTEADDIWSQGLGIIFTSGSADNQASCVYDFTASSDTITFWAITTAVTTEDYILIVDPVCKAADDEGS